jgi:hypothetical protein
MGSTPLYGGPPPRIPPSLLSECQFWGDNPLYCAKKFLGKKMTFFGIFMNMKYIIRESRLDDLFEKYIDSQYGLVFDKRLKSFETRDGEDFGDVFEKVFYYSDTIDRGILDSMFGDNADKLMFDYIRRRFPKVKIVAVENYWI